MIKVLHPCKASELLGKDLCVVYAEKNNVRYNIKGVDNDSECAACLIDFKENIADDFVETTHKTFNPQPIE